MDGGFRDHSGEDSFDALERRLRVRARGRADGHADRPASDATEPGAAELDIIAHLEQRQRALQAQGEAEGERLAARIAALAPGAGGGGHAAAAAVDVRQAAVRARGELNAARRRAEETRADLAAFRQEHRRRSAAVYPDSSLLAFGLLAVAAVFEAGFSAALFAQDDAHGLLGGAATAVGLSASNVSLGFLGGFLGLRYLQHVRLWPRAVGAACFGLALIGMLSLNGFAAVWRQDATRAASAQETAAAEASIGETYDRCVRRAQARQDAEAAFAAIQRCEQARRAGLANLETGARALSAQFSPQALVLLMLGFGVWTFAALKGFEGVDDRYPDYGRVTRLARDAEADLEALRLEAHEDMGAALEGVRQTQAAAAAQDKAAIEAMQAAYNAAQGLAALPARIGRLETLKQDLVALYRSENAATRRTPAPSHFAAASPQAAAARSPLEAAGLRLQQAKDEAAAARRAGELELSVLSAEVERALSGLAEGPAHGASA